MNPCIFPNELKIYFKNHDPVDRNNISNFFDTHPTVKDTFVNWAKEHQTFVHYTPRLSIALDVANDLGVGFEGLAQLINSIYHRLRYRNNEIIINEILSGINSDNVSFSKFSPSYAQCAAELYETGMIDKNHFFKFLSFEDKKNKTLLHYPENLKMLLPILGKQEFSELVKLSFAKDCFITLLQDNKAHQILLPFLLKQNPEDLIVFLKSKTRTGATLLHDANCLEILLPILLKQKKFEHLIRLLINKNSDGETPLHDANCLRRLIPLFEKIKPNEFAALMCIKNAKGDTPLHNTKCVEALFSLFKREKFTEFVMNVFKKENNGKIPEHVLFSETTPVLFGVEKGYVSHFPTIQNSPKNANVKNLSAWKLTGMHNQFNPEFF